MFKKKPSIKPAAPLRSSDRRRLADKIIQEFNLGKLESEDTTNQEEKAAVVAARSALRNSLLPENIQTARFTTTYGPDLKVLSGSVYIGSHAQDDPRVLWFDIDNRIYPTVYTLWQNPDMVALLHTPDIVVEKVQGGADLMIPGLADGPPFPKRARTGSIVAIASTSRPSVPVAVGVCEIDVFTLGSVQGQKGRAVESKHWYGDELSNYSSSARPSRALPDKITGWQQGSATEDLSAATDSIDLGDDINDEDETGGVAVVEESPIPNPAANPMSSGGSSDSPPKNSEQAKLKEWSQKDIDSAFQAAFLYGIYHYKRKHPDDASHGLEFPLSQSFVMSNLVQPHLPTFTSDDVQQLHIKKTSWRTTKKFIKSLDKQKILKSKEKDGNENIVVDVDFGDVAIVNFRPYRLPPKPGTTSSSSEKVSAQNGSVNEKDSAVGQRLQVLVLYRPSSKISILFAESGKPSFTSQEVRERINDYILQEELLFEGNKRLVKLDPRLADAIFDGSSPLDKEILAKGMIPRDALVERVIRAMNPAFAILRNDADPSSVNAKAGSPPKIHITLETRSGNKTVTKVSGLEVYYISPRPLADELRKTCAGSTSVEPLAGAAKKTEKEVLEVMIQGPQLDAVVKALGKRGVDRRWIEVQDKTKGKKR